MESDPRSIEMRKDSIQWRWWREHCSCRPKTSGIYQ